MTRELRNFAKNRIEYLIKISPFVFEERDREALEVAVMALSQEPCDDTISRQAAIDAFERFIHELGIKDEPYNYGEMALSAKNVPPVTPKLETVTEFADRCRECGARYGKLLEQKSGKWITTRTFMHDGEYYCDRCKCEAPNNEKWNYCPNCGAKMESEEQTE